MGSESADVEIELVEDDLAEVEGLGSEDEEDDDDDTDNSPERQREGEGEVRPRVGIVVATNEEHHDPSSIVPLNVQRLSDCSISQSTVKNYHVQVNKLVTFLKSADAENTPNFSKGHSNMLDVRVHATEQWKDVNLAGISWDGNLSHYVNTILLSKKTLLLRPAESIGT